MSIAWAGGAAFVAALLYLVYFYVVTLGSTAGDPAHGLQNAVVDTLLFSGFALHHSLLARDRAKHLLARVIPARFERSMYVWTASALAVAMCLAWQPVPGMVYRVDGVARVPFWMAQLLGAVVVLRAARVISPFELAGIAQAAGHRSSHALQIVGPFRFVRHPIYLGWIVMVFATPTLTANRLLFAVVSTLYLILAIPWEERSLAAVHGDRYRDYQRAVRWRLLPRVW